MVRRGIGWIDAERLDGIDCLQHLFDLRPPGNAQQTFAAGAHIWHRRVALARRDRAQDVDAGHDGSVVVRGPADEREDAAGRERSNAPLAVDHVLLGDLAEAKPVLDPLLDPRQFDMREVAHVVSPGLSGNSRVSRSQSFSATVTPRPKAATLMRPRSSGVMSIVNPLSVRKQIDGQIARGLNDAMWQEPTITDERVVEGNFDESQIARRADYPPQVNIRFLKTNNEWISGVGEEAIPQHHPPGLLRRRARRPRRPERYELLKRALNSPARGPVLDFRWKCCHHSWHEEKLNLRPHLGSRGKTAYISRMSAVVEVLKSRIGRRFV